MDNIMGEDCMEEADVEGMTYCWAYLEYNECTGEEMCYAYATVDGLDVEGDCDELEEQHGDDEDWYYDDECWVMGDVMGVDCMGEADVEGMTYCWAYFEYNECTGEEYCYAYATVDGYDVEGECDELEDQHGDDDDWYYDDECWVMDNIMGEDCMGEADVEGMTYCWAYLEYNECTGEEWCYAYATVDGLDVEGDCDELEDQHGNDDEWYGDECETFSEGPFDCKEEMFSDV